MKLWRIFVTRILHTRPGALFIHDLKNTRNNASSTSQPIWQIAATPGAQGRGATQCIPQVANRGELHGSISRLGVDTMQIIQEIAYFLPTDFDVINFALSCSSIAHKILPSDSSIWRYRFRDLYDIPEDRSSNELKIEYQIRSIVLSQNVDFSHGQHEKQTLYLEVLKDMLIEYHTLLTKNKQSTSRTRSYIRKILGSSEFLNRPTSGYGDKEPAPPSDLFCAVQLVS